MRAPVRAAGQARPALRRVATARRRLAAQPPATGKPTSAPRPGGPRPVRSPPSQCSARGAPQVRHRRQFAAGQRARHRPSRLKHRPSGGSGRSPRNRLIAMSRSNSSARLGMAGCRGPAQPGKDCRRVGAAEQGTTVSGQVLRLAALATSGQRKQGDLVQLGRGMRLQGARHAAQESRRAALRDAPIPRLAAAVSAGASQPSSRKRPTRFIDLACP